MKETKDDLKDIKELADFRAGHPFMFFFAEFFFYCGILGLLRNVFFKEAFGLNWLYFIAFVFTVIDFVTLQIVKEKMK